MPIKRGGKKLPAIIFLHGIGQNKNFLKEITSPFNQVGFAFVSSTNTPRASENCVASHCSPGSKAFAARPAKTINETRRLIDYLSAHPDIDPKRIYLVGASYGAVTGSTVMAKDKRLRAGVLVYGGGDFRKLLDSYANHLGVAAVLGLIDGKEVNPRNRRCPS